MKGNRVQHIGWLALGALSGLLAGAAALGAAELVAAALRPQASVLTVVNEAVVRHTPAPVAQWALDTFKPNHKTYLQLGTAVSVGLIAMGLGVLALHRRRTGAAGVLLFGAVGAAAALSGPASQAWDIAPPLLGAPVGAAVLYLLAGRLTTPAPGPSVTEAPDGSGQADDAPSPVTSAPTAGAATAGEPAAGEPATGEPATGEPATVGTGGGKPYLRLTDGGAGDRPTFDRRGFVIAASAAAAASAGAGVLGRHLNASSGAEAAASRTALSIPAPADAAKPQPAGADLDVDGLSPFFTPNDEFYRVDTAIRVPRVDATTWRLRIGGQGVRTPLTLSFDDLLGRELVERDITLTCVSNQVGGPYVGTARWIGVPLADLLREAGVRPPSAGGPADQLVSRSVDGMAIGTPVETVMDGRDALLAFGMNGKPLPFDHGFPVRMVVPGLYGYVSACKWLRELELTTFAAYDAYWVKRDWAARAPVKTQSRIDTPRPLASLSPGRVPVAGVAWAQHRGVARVEVRVDQGPWERAELAPAATEDTWRQWLWEWDATPGRHTLEVRATDGEGRTQTSERVGTVPDGATGWHSVVVTVT
ncbi:molybdopterin-dependent oxidoreductase [Streptomyces sp. JJ66]|uniref:molybdopterin-dependent oxidoreductase n=1 Tax=Streptomyces sp. JJ66 TaxID=2803843 RepID=UPI0027E23100|nr:molybdopterin-dependent oxidoreductase [Streptomyces sp. JJ66]